MLERNHCFSFRTTYPGDELSLYWAHLIDHAYQVSVGRNQLDCSIEFSLEEVFDRVQSGEWIVVEKF